MSGRPDAAPARKLRPRASDANGPSAAPCLAGAMVCGLVNLLADDGHRYLAPGEPWPRLGGGPQAAPQTVALRASQPGSSYAAAALQPTRVRAQQSPQGSAAREEIRGGSSAHAIVYKSFSATSLFAYFILSHTLLQALSRDVERVWQHICTQFSWLPGHGRASAIAQNG